MRAHSCLPSCTPFGHLLTELCIVHVRFPVIGRTYLPIASVSAYSSLLWHSHICMTCILTSLRSCMCRYKRAISCQGEGSVMQHYRQQPLGPASQAARRMFRSAEPQLSQQLWCRVHQDLQRRSPTTRRWEPAISASWREVHEHLQRQSCHAC